MVARRRVVLASIAALGLSLPLAAQKQTPGFSPPAWAYPTSSPPYAPVRPPYDTVKRITLPGSSQSFTMAQLKNSYSVPDWFPDSHPPMPDPVAHGVPRKVAACGYCHLADGQGRSENGALAGLTADYIIEQVHDFRSRKRKEAIPRWGFQTTMENIADSVSDHDLEIAAKYFASIRPRPRVKVLERTEIQRSYQANGLSALHPDGGLEPLGNRIVEITEDIERHDLRDPRTGFIAYVPVGSIERGRKIAHATGKDAARACVTCHGDNLLGKGPAPLIAGRSPAYILRQLMAFKTHSRDAPSSGPMQTVTAPMTLDDMIAVSAYVGSRLPK
jgi:cytochrome c553